MNITEESNQITLDKHHLKLKDLSIKELKGLKDKIDIEIYRKSR